MGRLVHINVSQGGVPKLPVASAQVGPGGVGGDKQRYLKIHGGPDRAVCLFSRERLDQLRAEGHPIEPGSMGENLTVEGIDWAAVKPGARVRVGAELLLEITRYTEPCKNIGFAFKDRDFTRVAQESHPGWSRVYARVLEPGQIKQGDAVELVPL